MMDDTAFKMGYDDYPEYANQFEPGSSMADFYASGWATARKHDSPAFYYKSDSYPYGDRLPHKVRMLVTVESDLPYMTLAETAVEGEVYEACTNSHGAVSVYLPCGEKLGVKPGEFEIEEWY